MLGVYEYINACDGFLLQVDGGNDDDNGHEIQKSQRRDLSCFWPILDMDGLVL